MMLRVSFSAQALRDIEFVLRRYHQVASKQIASDFLEEIERLSALISSSPRMEALRDGPTITSLRSRASHISSSTGVWTIASYAFCASDMPAAGR